MRGPANPDRVSAMSATLRHRGPDSFGEYVDGPVALAARRLSIIDLETGDQPVANEDGSLQVVQNGELYNYRELRRELETHGHRFATSSDTEVVVHAYEQWGTACLDRFRGMFAFALWDEKKDTLFLARDRLGEKPLYYRQSTDGLEFASELRALPRGEIDLDALEAFLAFNSIPAPLTIFRDVRKLPPGHLLLWEDGTLRLEQYARPRPVLREEQREEDELVVIRVVATRNEARSLELVEGAFLEADRERAERLGALLGRQRGEQ